MKKLFLTFLLAVSSLASSFAQAPAGTAASNANVPPRSGSARDGFTLRGAEVVVTRNGVTSKVEREMTFSTGLRVQANGNFTLRDGSTGALRPNQLLAFDGSLQEVLLSSDGVAPLSSVDTGPSPKPLVSPSAADGIRISGTDVFITRNGATDKVKGDVRLPNGVTVKAGGTVVLGNGNIVTLRPDQILDLNGVLRDASVR